MDTIEWWAMAGFFTFCAFVIFSFVGLDIYSKVGGVMDGEWDRIPLRLSMYAMPSTMTFLASLVIAPVIFQMTSDQEFFALIAMVPVGSAAGYYLLRQIIRRAVTVSETSSSTG